MTATRVRGRRAAGDPACASRSTTERASNHRAGRRYAARVDWRATGTGESTPVGRNVCGETSITGRIARRWNSRPRAAIARKFNGNAVPIVFHLMAFPVGQIHAGSANRKGRSLSDCAGIISVMRARGRSGVAIGISTTWSVIRAGVVGGIDESPNLIGNADIELEERSYVAAAICPSARSGLQPGAIGRAGNDH